MLTPNGSTQLNKHAIGDDIFETLKLKAKYNLD